MKKMYPFEVVNKLKQGESNAIVAQLSEELSELHARFAETDYKTIKNQQYEAMGLELPYPWQQVYEEAEAIRVQIRAKEEELSNLLQLGE